MKDAGQYAVFGKRKEPHTVIIARGSEIRHFTVRPWLAAVFGGGLASLLIAYLLATTYLVLRDDLMGAASARQARMQQAYEDRIASLRAQVDRITSRQLLDQQLVETKVTELLSRQSELSARHGLLAPQPGEAAETEAAAPQEEPSGEEKPRASLDVGKVEQLAFAADSASSPFSFWSTRSSQAGSETEADRADKMFVAINKSLRAIEAQQITKLDTLASNAYEKVEAIGNALQNAGIEIEDDFGKSDVGGPLVPIDSATMFDSKVKDLDEALNRLDELKNEARNLPISNPAPGRSVSSTFGVRTDPLLGMPAMHSGMDFRAPAGTPILATGTGTVTEAGWNGGYGKMVEIEHANGFSTRFAHMSRILVQVGDQIKAGDIIGEVGSTGRSTGPHIHYEVRRGGKATDPLRFIKAGSRIGSLIQ